MIESYFSFVQLVPRRFRLHLLTDLYAGYHHLLIQAQGTVLQALQRPLLRTSQCYSYPQYHLATPGPCFVPKKPLESDHNNDLATPNLTDNVSSLPQAVSCWLRKHL